MSSSFRRWGVGCVVVRFALRNRLEIEDMLKESSDCAVRLAKHLRCTTCSVPLHVRLLVPRSCRRFRCVRAPLKFRREVYRFAGHKFVIVFSSFACGHCPPPSSSLSANCASPPSKSLGRFGEMVQKRQFEAKALKDDEESKLKVSVAEAATSAAAHSPLGRVLKLQRCAKRQTVQWVELPVWASWFLVRARLDLHTKVVFPELVWPCPGPEFIVVPVMFVREEQLWRRIR